MKICFTLCSNNYLAQASLLASSFMDHNPEYEFFIGLVDDVQPGVNYPVREKLHVLSCREVVPPEQLKQMAEVYKIVELNTSVKPFFMDYFFKKYEECKLIYLDPDIYVYHSFTLIDALLDQYDFVITPHCLSPIPLDGKQPQERAFMKYGTYNLGFIALRKSSNSLAYVNWLKERLAVLCYSEVNIGVYVDQSWVNFLPVFFDKVYVSHHPGMNAAFWNLHERRFTQKNGRYYVNETEDLLFFHFSSFDIANWQLLSRHQTRFTAKTRPDVSGLFEQYAILFKQAREVYNSRIQCVFTKRTLAGKLRYYWNRYQIRKTLAT